MLPRYARQLKSTTFEQDQRASQASPTPIQKCAVQDCCKAGILADIVKSYDLQDHEVDSGALTANLSNTHLDGPSFCS